jgi:membrane protein
MEGTTITATPEKAAMGDRRAQQPAQIRTRGWIQVAKRSWKRAKANQVPLLAAGVAFYAFLAVFPALIAIVSIYGLFADTSKIPNHLSSLTTALPDEASKVLNDQVTTLTARPSTLVRSVLWSPRTSVVERIGCGQQPATAIDVAYDEESAVSSEAIAISWADPCRHCLHGDHAESSPSCRPAESNIRYGTLRWVFQILGWLVLVLLVAK